MPSGKLMRIVEIATNARCSIEITPDKGAFALRFRHADTRASATVSMDADGTLRAWRTGGRPSMDALKQAIA